MNENKMKSSNAVDTGFQYYKCSRINDIQAKELNKKVSRMIWLPVECFNYFELVHKISRQSSHSILLSSQAHNMDPVNKQTTF